MYAIRSYYAKMKTRTLLPLFALVAYLCVASAALAADVTLAWDPNPSTGVTGYKMYYKAGSSSTPFDGTGAVEGNSPVILGDTLTTTLTGLDDGVVYYFTVVAYAANGNESPYSNVVAWSAGDPNPYIPSLVITSYSIHYTKLYDTRSFSEPRTRISKTGPRLFTTTPAWS